jgi:superfamily II DNA or RNA helicase
MNEELKNVIKNLKISYHSGHGDNLGKDFYSPLLAKCKQYKRDTGDFTSTVIFDWGEALLNVINRDDEECVIKLIANPKLNDEDFETLSQVVENKDREEYLDKIGRNILDEAFSLSQGTAERKIKLKIFAYLVTTNKLIIKFGFPRHVRGANIYHPKSGVFYFDNDIKVGFIGGSNETHGGHLTNIEYIQVHNNLEENNKYLDDVEEKFDIGWKNLAPGFQTCALNQDTLKKIKSYAPKSKQELKQEIEKYNTENKPKLGEHLSDETKQKLNQIKEELVLEDYLKIIEEKWRFQERARLKFIEKKWGLLEMATGTGKTRIALAIATQLINENKIDKIIIQMFGADLLRQWRDRINEWLNSKIDREINFLECSEDKNELDSFILNFKNPEADLLLIRQSNLSDLLNKIKDNDQSRTLIIHDEVHDLGADKISQKIAGKQNKFGYKLGLSPTIREEWDKKRERFYFDEIQGGGDEPIFTLDFEKAIKLGVLVESELIKLSYRLFPDERTKKSSCYAQHARNIKEGMSKLEADKLRNFCLVDVNKNARNKIQVFEENIEYLKEKLKRSFIFTDEIDYGKTLLNILTPYLNVKTHFQGSDRKNLDFFSEGKIDCIINVLKLSQGIDIQKLNTIVLFATPTGRQFIQRIGRVLRKDQENKEKRAIIVDFFEEDDLRNEEEHSSDYKRYLMLKNITETKYEDR